MADTADIAAKAAQLEQLLRQSQTQTQDALTVLENWRRMFFEIDTSIKDVAKRSNQLSHVRESLWQARNKVEEIQENLDTADQVERRISAGPGSDFGGFFRAFDRLDASVAFVKQHSQLMPKDSNKGTNSGTKKLLNLRDVGLKLCLDYYTQLLRQHTTVPNSMLWDGDTLDTMTDGVELMPAPVCKRLRRMTDLLLRHHDDRTLPLYEEARMGVHRRLLKGLDYEGVDSSNLRLELLEEKIEAWVKGIRVCARIGLLERQLASAVFAPPHNDRAFHNVIEPSLNAVLKLGISLLKAKRLHEKLFGLLDMHDHLQKALPVLSIALQGLNPGASDTKYEKGLEKILYAFEMLDQDLQMECRATFGQFCDDMRKISTRDISTTGSVDRFTVYALNYLKRLFQYQEGTTITFAVGPVANVLHRQHREGSQWDPQLQDRIIANVRKALDLLVANVKGKSNALAQGGKTSLGFLFMMNNLHHIVTRVSREDSAMAIVGEAWIQAAEDEVEQCGQKYIQSTWGPLIKLVQQSPAQLGKEKVKDHLKIIKTRVDEIEAEEKMWQIPDDSLRENLRIYIVEEFVQQYEAYLQNFRASFPNKVVRYENKYIKFTGDDLRMIIYHKLFMGGADANVNVPDALLDNVGR